MSESALVAVMDRFINDASFREGILRNSEETLRTSGMPLSEDEMTAILNTD
jgi:hypothetical protein